MPPRVLVSLEEIALNFGGKPLFGGLDIHIAQGDKVCLVGKNGAGKTTLMRLIEGQLEPDKGKRFALPGISIGYLAQTMPAASGISVQEFVLSGLPREERTEEKRYLADQVIAPLGLSATQGMDALSGGQARRAALAQALICNPDLLMLDEPTNHLDLGAIEWLEQYLRSYRGAVLCVSHDRAFLKTVSRKVFWIDRGMIRICPGGYEMFEDWSAQIVEQEMRELQNMQKKFEAEVDWTQGGVSARRKRNQRRLNELKRLREKLKVDKFAMNQRLRKIELDPLTPIQGSKVVAEFKDVSKTFVQDGVKNPILEHFHFRIMRGDRIGILGKNGTGKSTFIKLLTQQIAPDQGRVSLGKTIDIAYLDQHRSALDPQATLWDTLCPDGGDHVFFGTGDERRSWHVCGYLKAFLFDPKQARDKVATLSGGQQNRLMLAMLLTRPSNVLILDEPTNDLDMDTLDMLQEILSEYKGTLIVVSHDRDFLDRTVTEILAFEGQGIIEGCIGGYSDYIEHKKTRVPAKKAEAMSAVAETKTSSVKSSKLSFKLKYELEQLPEKIAALEIEAAQLKQMLDDPSFYMNDPKAFDAVSSRYTRAQEELTCAETRWLELEALREEK